MTRARTAYLPLMLQLAGITRSSGNKASRISRSRSARHAAPSRAPSFLPARNSLRRDEAAFPQSLAIFLGAGLVGLEASAGGCFDIQAKSTADDQLAEACGFALDLADADAPFLVGGVGAEIVAAHLAIADQFRQLIAGLDAAGPDVGVFVDAELVDGRRIDAVEPKGDITQLQRAAIADDGRGSRTLGGREQCR